MAEGQLPPPRRCFFSRFFREGGWASGPRLLFSLGFFFPLLLQPAPVLYLSIYPRVIARSEEQTVGCVLSSSRDQKTSAVSFGVGSGGSFSYPEAGGARRRTTKWRKKRWVSTPESRRTRREKERLVFTRHPRVSFPGTSRSQSQYTILRELGSTHTVHFSSTRDSKRCDQVYEPIVARHEKKQARASPLHSAKMGATSFLLRDVGRMHPKGCRRANRLVSSYHDEGTAVTSCN